MTMGDIPGFNVARSYCFAYLTATTTPTPINTTHKIPLAATLFDLGDEFDTDNNRWVCPEDGYYNFDCRGNYQNVNHNTTGFSFDLVTSNQTYGNYGSTWQWDAQGGYWPRRNNVISWMDEGDTALLNFYQQGGSTGVKLYHGSGGCVLIVTRIS